VNQPGEISRGEMTPSAFTVSREISLLTPLHPRAERWKQRRSYRIQLTAQQPSPFNRKEWEMTISNIAPQHTDATHREAIKAILEAENWIGECSGSETAIALGLIAVAKTNLALGAQLLEIAKQLEGR
jgi:hypothetical protein